MNTLSLICKTYHMQEPLKIQRKCNEICTLHFHIDPIIMKSQILEHVLVHIYLYETITLLQDRKSHTVHQENRHVDMPQQYIL